MAQLITRDILNQNNRKFPFNTQRDDVSRFQDRVTHIEAQITSARTTEAASKALTSRQKPQRPVPSGPNDSLRKISRKGKKLPSAFLVRRYSIQIHEEKIYSVVHFIFQDCSMIYEETIARLRGRVTENIRYNEAEKAKERIAKLRACVMENVQ